MNSQILKKDERHIQTIIENNSDIVPLVHNFGMAKKINKSNVSHTSTLIEMHNALSSFGLNKNEINVYLFLVRFGNQKASRVAENLGITRSETYKILRNLESQGIILRLVEKPYKYLAIPVEDVFNMFLKREYEQVKQIERKKDELLEKWKLIKSKPMKNEINTMIFQVLEGTSHIYIKLKELVERNIGSIKIIVSSDILLWLYNTPFFELLEDKKNVSGSSLNYQLIAEASDVSEFVISDISKDVFDFKLVKNLNIPGFVISDEDEILLLIQNGPEELYAMWTNYDSIVGTNKHLFSFFWDEDIRNNLS
jgi:sugar-specific transcriptional regulator TrmB